MNNISENPYETPSANLTTPSSTNKSALKFNRFTAWGVFGLSIITLGIYPVYWLYSRALVINRVHDNQISTSLMYAMIVIAIISFATGLFGENEQVAMIGGIITVIYSIVYLVLLFTIRNRIRDMMNNGGDALYDLSPVLTFFFNSIYLQYKINEYIDEQSSL